MPQDFAPEISEYFSCLQEWDASYEEYAKSVGLSYTSLALLSAIYGSEACTQKMLCQRCFLQKQTVNAAVTAFYKRGWVSLEELPQDRRNKAVVLTETGRQEAQRILCRIRQSEQQAMSRLTEEERRVLLSATRKYVTACKEAMQGL